MKRLIVLSLVCAGATAPAWGAACEGYSKTLTVTLNRALTGPGTLLDFTARVIVAHDWLRTAANGGFGQSADGYDHCYADPANTVAYSWAPKAGEFSAATGAIYDYVKVPAVNGSDQAASTQMLLYFGKAGENAPNPSGPWDSHYKLVQPLGTADGSNLDTTDYTGINTPAIVGFVPLASGPGGGPSRGASFSNNAANYIDNGTNPALALATVTFEAWVTFRSTPVSGENPTWIATDNGASLGGYLNFFSGSEGWYYIQQFNHGAYGGGSQRNGSFPPANSWVYLVTQRSPGNMKVFVNGIRVANGTDGATGSGVSMAVGAYGKASPSNPWNGLIAEVMVSDSVAARGQNYITASYNNLRAPSRFLSLSDAASPPTAPPVISGVVSTGHANSVQIAWTTDSYSSSKVQCGTSSGGPYTTYATGTLDPVKRTDSFYGVLKHDVSLSGLAPGTQYYCQALSDNLYSLVYGGTTITAVQVVTTATATITTRMQVTADRATFRVNDQYNGANGIPKTGSWYWGDTQYFTMLPDGRWFGQSEDCRNVNGAAYGQICMTLWPTADLLNPLHLTSYYTSLPPACRYAPIEAITVRGTTYFQQSVFACPNYLGASGNGYVQSSWLKLIVDGGTNSLWSLAPQNNVNQWSFLASGYDRPSEAAITAASVSDSPVPNTVTLTTNANIPAGTQISVQNVSCSGGNPNTTGTSTVSVATSSSTGLTYVLPAASGATGCTTANAFVYANLVNDAELVQWIQCANGLYDNCPHVGGLDQWVYAYESLGTRGGVLLSRIAVQDLALQDYSKKCFYTGSQTADDGMGDANWDCSANKVANARPLVGGPYAFREVGSCKPHGQFIPDFNRFLLICNADSYGGSMSGGLPVWDLLYPWSTPIFAGAVYRDVVKFPYFNPAFPNIMPGSYSLLSSSPLNAYAKLLMSGTVVNLAGSATGATEEYSLWSKGLTISPYRERPMGARWNARGIPGNGLLMAYLHQDPPGGGVIADQTANHTLSVPGKFVNTDQYGWYYLAQTGTAFSYPVYGPPNHLALNTGLTDAMDDFTYAWCGGHLPSTSILPAASGEIIVNKNGDLKLARHLLTDSWDLSVSGTTVGAIPLADGTFGCIIVTRRGSSVNAYASSGIGTAPPLTPAVAGTAAGKFGRNPLYLGDSLNAAHVIHSVNLMWNRALTDAELISLRAALAGIMEQRGAALP